MNPPNKSTTVFPQTEEIPVPLEIHPSVSPLAAELLMKVAERIATDPHQYNQGNFTGHHKCNSPCCILGHCALVAGLRLDYDGTGNKNANPLGLTNQQYINLFWAGLWPVSTLGEMNKITAQQGIARIEFFLRTGQ